jgi:hypothetical protein
MFISSRQPAVKACRGHLPGAGAPVPWALMARAAIAVCGPLAFGLIVLHNSALALLPAIGGLIASVVDIGGPYPARLRRVASATVLGGATGLIIGSLIHGRGWIAFAVLVAVACVSALLAAAGQEEFAAARLDLTKALNTAHDQLLAVRSASSGPDRQMMRLVALLTQTHLVAEALTTVAVEGRRPPTGIVSAAQGLADAIRAGTAPAAPPAWRGSPGARAVTEALAGTARLLTTDRLPPERQPLARPSRRDRIGQVADQLTGGRLVWQSAIRLSVCIGVAAFLADVLPAAAVLLGDPEPPAASRRATLWWPAVVGLEQVMDTVTAAAVAADHGAPLPQPECLRELTRILRNLASGASTPRPPQPAAPPSAACAGPVTDAVLRVQAALV